MRRHLLSGPNPFRAIVAPFIFFIRKVLIVFCVASMAIDSSAIGPVHCAAPLSSMLVVLSALGKRSAAPFRDGFRSFLLQVR